MVREVRGRREEHEMRRSALTCSWRFGGEEGVGQCAPQACLQERSVQLKCSSWGRSHSCQFSHDLSFRSAA